MKTRRYFSLIELLIVIGIMGALAALILPAFSDSESAAKDTACDYNQAGTLRYLKMFHSANGVYPTGFHTGGSTPAWTKANQDTDVKLTPCGTYNFNTGSSDLVLTSDKAQTWSLINAGIVSLACGQGADAKMVALTKLTAEGVQQDPSTITVKQVNGGSSNYWTEDLDAATGEVDPQGKPLAYRGVGLNKIADIGAVEMTQNSSGEDVYQTADDADKIFRAENEDQFVIVPLYVAPTIDWEHYYSDGPNDSKISIAMPGKCPWGEDGNARYYIAFFKVYYGTKYAADTVKDVPAAKLLCTSCPDCGILEANAF